jgi:uncharacterized protein YoxC
MSAASVVTLIGVGLVVVALAVYLATIAYLLKKVSFTLGTVLIGVRAIANQTQPVNVVVNDIVDDVAAIQKALEGLLAQAQRSPRQAGAVPA